jgi:hypothetical protein
MGYIKAKFASHCSVPDCRRKVRVGDQVWWESGRIVVCPECHMKGKEGRTQDAAIKEFKVERLERKLARPATPRTHGPYRQHVSPVEVNNDPPLHPKCDCPELDD